jgi:hypothetical protein
MGDTEAGRRHLWWRLKRRDVGHDRDDSCKRFMCGQG